MNDDTESTPEVAYNYHDKGKTKESWRFRSYMNKTISKLVDDNAMKKFASIPNSNLNTWLSQLTNTLYEEEFEKLLCRLPVYFGFIINNGHLLCIICNDTSTRHISITKWSESKLLFDKYELTLDLEDNVYNITIACLLDIYYSHNNEIYAYKGITHNPNYKGSELINIHPNINKIVRFKGVPEPNPLLLGYVRCALSSESDICYKYIINWLINLAVDPYSQTGVCPIITGKKINLLFIENFISCVYGKNNAIITDHYSSVMGADNKRIINKYFIICVEREDHEFTSKLSGLENLVIDDYIMINSKEPIELFMCMNFCIVSNNVHPEAIGSRNFPIFNFSSDYDNMDEVNSIISDKEEMMKFVSWLQTHKPALCRDMLYECVTFDDNTDFWNSLSFDEIIDLIDISSLGTNSKRYGHRIEFNEIYIRYEELCKEYNQIPMEKNSLYSQLRKYYSESNNREFIHKYVRGQQNILIRRDNTYD